MGVQWDGALELAYVNLEEFLLEDDRVGDEEQAALYQLRIVTEDVR
jgi:hypothetical protein